MKPTIIAFDAAARLTSFSVIPPTPVWMTLTRTSGCWIFPSSETIASTEPCTSPLMTMFRSWTPPACICSKSLSSETPPLPLLRHRLAAQALAALLRELAGAPLVLDDAAELAGGRRTVEAEDLDGLARARLLDALAAVVVERAHAAPGIAGDDRVADLERAAVDEHRRDRAAADVEARLDDRAGRLGGRVRAQVELGVGDEQDPLEQVVEVLALLRRDARDLHVAAPLLGLQPFGRELAEHAVGVRVGQIDLVDGDDDRHVGGARVRDRLACVCGMTPSSAATTSTAMSVTFAPRARMAVNASWPGVSRNVIRRPSWSAW